MANTHSTLTSLFTDIADAIRGKTKGTAKIVADNFPEAIAAIPAEAKFASGTIKAASSYSKTLTISGIGFKPKAIIITAPQWYSEQASFVSIYYDFENTSRNFFWVGSMVYQGNQSRMTATASEGSVSFSYTTQGDTGFTTYIGSYSWVAIG